MTSYTWLILHNYLILFLSNVFKVRNFMVKMNVSDETQYKDVMDQLLTIAGETNVTVNGFSPHTFRNPANTSSPVSSIQIEIWCYFVVTMFFTFTTYFWSFTLRYKGKNYEVNEIINWNEKNKEWNHREDNREKNYMLLFILWCFLLFILCLLI